MGFSGCYVIATYAHPVKKGDFSKFRDLYVGKSENVGDSIFKDSPVGETWMCTPM